jgi:hypothetical protein
MHLPERDASLLSCVDIPLGLESTTKLAPTSHHTTVNTSVRRWVSVIWHSYLSDRINLTNARNSACIGHCAHEECKQLPLQLNPKDRFSRVTDRRVPTLLGAVDYEHKYLQSCFQKPYVKAMARAGRKCGTDVSGSYGGTRHVTSRGTRPSCGPHSQAVTDSLSQTGFIHVHWAMICRPLWVYVVVRLMLDIMYDDEEL